MMDFCVICSPSMHAVPEAVRLLLLLGGLLCAAWTDVRSRKISNRLLLFLLCAGGVSVLLESCADREWVRIQDAFTGLAVGGGLCFFCYLVSGGGIGAGDVKLFAVTGFYVGKTEVLRMAWVTVLLAAGGCAVLLLLKKADRNTGVPCAPFVFLAVVAVLMERSG